MGAPDAPLVAEISAVLCKHDPLGTCDELNQDEYLYEAGRVVQQLPGVRTPDDLVELLYREFQLVVSSAPYRNWFIPVAREVWDVWKHHGGPGPLATR